MFWTPQGSVGVLTQPYGLGLWGPAIVVLLFPFLYGVPQTTKTLVGRIVPLLPSKLARVRAHKFVMASNRGAPPLFKPLS